MAKPRPRLRLLTAPPPRCIWSNLPGVPHLHSSWKRGSETMSALTCARDVCHMFQGRTKGRPIWPPPRGKQKELEGVAQQGRNFFLSLTNFPSRRYQPMRAREGGGEF